MIALALGDLNNKEKMEDIFFSTPVRIRHTDTFERTFKKLLTAAEAVDTENMIVDALLNGSADGLFYKIIRYASGEVESDPMPGIISAPIAGTNVII
jgi:hypothetical protein